MKCPTPTRFDGVNLAPCGQCVQCRINDQRAWATRIRLEMLTHGANTFLTLTYAEAPEGLVKRDVQLFLKRFRKAYGKPVRYFACGEFGSRYGRPHYHLILFGVACSPAMEELCAKTWNLGFVSLKEATNIGVARYVAKYILKKTSLDRTLQDGQNASFALMSRRPGIGRRMLEVLADRVRSMNIMTNSSLGLDYRTGQTNWDQSTKLTSGACVRVDGHLNPLDRYAKRVMFPEKEGDGVTRLNTLIEHELARKGGSFSDVLTEAEAIHEGRMRGIKALKGLRESVL